VGKYCRLGALGRKFNAYVPVGTWVRKANREMVVKARQLMPRLVAVVGSCPVSAGALAQIKASLEVTLVHIWPDTLVNLDSSLIECLPLYDLECVYSQSAVKPIQKLGATRPVWVPLAGDPSIHSVPQCTESEAVVFWAGGSFFWGWGPGRGGGLLGCGQFDIKKLGTVLGWET